VTNYVWNVDANGDWNTRDDWSPVGVPTVGADVSINTTNFHTISHTTGKSTVHTLFVGLDNFALSGGSLTVQSGARFNNGLAIGAHGSIDFASSESVVYGALTASAARSIAIGNGAVLFVAGGGSALPSVFKIASQGVLDFYGGTFNSGAGTFNSGLVEVNGAVLSLGAGAVTIAGNLGQENGEIVGTGTLTVKGNATFTYAAFSDHDDVQLGKGTTILDGTTNQDGSIYLDGGRTLKNAGQYVWSGGNIELGTNPFATLSQGGGTFDNLAGGTLLIENNQVVGAQGVTRFVNAGTLIKSLATGGTEIDPDFSNSGMISIKSGDIDVVGGFSNTNIRSGAISISAGATLQLLGGGATAAAALNIAGGGAVEIDGGTFTVKSGTAAGTGVISMFGTGTLMVGLGAKVTVTGGLTQESGTIAGTGTLIFKGVSSLQHTPFADNDFDFETGKGTTVFAGDTSVTGDVYLDGGRTMENSGSLTWTAGSFGLGDDPLANTSLGTATLKNAAGGTFDIQSDDSIQSIKGNTSFANAGTLIKSATNGTTTIGVASTNTGTISVQTGTLEFDSSFVNTNSKANAIAVEAGAELDFDGGGSSTGTALTIAAQGTLAIDGGAFTLTSGATKGSGTLAVDDGTLLVGGMNSVTVSGGLFQQGGTISGTGTLTFKGVSSFEHVPFTDNYAFETGAGKTILAGSSIQNSDIYLDGGRTLTNAGSYSLTFGSIEMGANPYANHNLGNATLNNAAGGTFDIEYDSSIDSIQGNTKFTNAGTLIKSATVGTTAVGVAFSNSGTIAAKSGTLEFDAGFTNTNAKSNAITIAAGAALDIHATGMSSASAFTIGGELDITAGTFTLGAGTLKETGSGSIQINGGTLCFGAGVAVPVVTFADPVPFSDIVDTLKLTETGTIATKLANFAGSSVLDLAMLKFGGSSSLNYAENAANTQGTLTVKSGAASVSIVLFGQYTAAGFAMSKDAGGTGIAVTYSAPSDSVGPLSIPQHH
jgi:hypothetical protein